MQGLLQVWDFSHGIWQEKSECLTAGAMLRSFALYFFLYFVQRLSQFHEWMTTGITGKMYLLEAF